MNFLLFHLIQMNHFFYSLIINYNFNNIKFLKKYIINLLLKNFKFKFKLLKNIYIIYKNKKYIIFIYIYN